MPALICGSFAYDTIMLFPDRFKNHILPDHVHILNVSFMVPTMRRDFGGCAGNIAYNLSLLGSKGTPMGTVGMDAEPYLAWLEQCKVSCRYIKRIDGVYTAQAFITTDQDDNQITAFHPGAMNHAHENRVPRDAGYTIGLVSPDGRQGMIEHAEQFAEAGIPFMFDPGQGLPMFQGADLLRFIDQAQWLAVNDYELKLMQERTGLSVEGLAERVSALIVTRGAQGSLIIEGKHRHEIPPVKPRAVVDPTGCGDAYRAGLLQGLMQGMDWPTTGRMASLMGAIKIASAGTQNHHCSVDEFAQEFRENFGYAL
jgi:adenosine kinase